ncbi:MAG: hypothetical protein PHT83_00880 [Bacilli bacterium]|nr:hypothetical protein [Bacilli bacterium]
MKCLFAFENLLEFKKTIFKLQLGSVDWQIRDMSLDDRIKKVEGYQYFTNLKEYAIKQGLDVDDKEVISWLDSINIISSLIESLDHKHIAETSIIAEYHIPYTTSRIDYMLLNGNNIIIIEFSFKKTGDNDNYQFHEKVTQCSSYKESLSNILKKRTKIYTHTFLIQAEYNSYGKKLRKDNNLKIMNLKDYILNCFYKEKSSVYQEIINL